MILREYVKGDIRRNQASYRSTRISIFLAVLILAIFLLGVSSYYGSFRREIKKETGGYHFRIVNTVSKKDSQDLLKNRHVDRLGLMTIKELDQAFGSKEKTRLFKIDKNAIQTLETWIKEGELPGEGELMISNEMAKEISRGLGDTINIQGQDYRIAGIFFDRGYEFETYYNVFLNQNQAQLLAEEEEFSPFVWYKNIFRTYSLSEEIMANMESQDITYNYNRGYLDRSLVFDPDDDLIKDHTSEFIILVLFIILLVLFYSIIVNLFLVQESKSLREYATIKSLGGRDQDIRRIVQLKSLYISQLPIGLAIVTGHVLIGLLFMVLNRIEGYFGHIKDGMASSHLLSLDINLGLVAFIYLVALGLVYLSTGQPIKKLNKSSIADGLRGDIGEESSKKYDLRPKGDIERDLSLQFYKNSRRDFRFTSLSLALGFLLLVFVVSAISFYKMETKYNHRDKYQTYNIQGEYRSLKPLDPELYENIKQLDIEEGVNYRREFVYMDYDEDLIDPAYLGDSMASLLDKSSYVRVALHGVEDQDFNARVAQLGLDPDDYKDGKVLALNTMGHNFDRPASLIENKKFLKDGVEEISLSEYGDVLRERGHEFSLNVEDKLDQPLFDYEIRKDMLNVFMKKSEYIRLMDQFLKLADLDQREFIALRARDIDQVQNQVDDLSREYFKENDYGLASQLDEERLVRKNSLRGNIVGVFISLFFIVVGFSNAYFSFYNLYLKRRESLMLYKTLGMDRQLLVGVLNREKRKLIRRNLFYMPLVVLLAAYLIALSTKIFSFMEILLHLNYLFILVYMLLIYLALSLMYNKYKREII